MKFLLLNDTHTFELTLKDWKRTEQDVLKLVNMKLANEGKAIYTEIKTIKRGQHICKYCYTNIVDSSDKDRLCDECREVFGHSFYSDL